MRRRTFVCSSGEFIRRASSFFHWLARVAASVALSGCDSTPGPPPDTSGFDEDELLSAIVAYRDGELELVNPEPFASRAVEGRFVRVWASPEVVDDYRLLPHVKPMSLPPGALIVRELSDADGVVVKLTALARGESGSNPAVGDLWFAATTLAGEPLVDPAGVPQIGAVPECSGCHLTRQSNGFIYGPTP